MEMYVSCPPHCKFNERKARKSGVVEEVEEAELRRRLAV
jgi:hypothetical protein